MTVIGTLYTHEDAKGYKQLRGQIQTLDLDLSIWFEPLASRATPDSPHFQVFAKSRGGKPVQVGSVWRKQLTRGPRAGEEFFSLTLDDPGFAAPLNVAAFKAERPDEWEITWRRRQDRQPAEAEQG